MSALHIVNMVSDLRDSLVNQLAWFLDYNSKSLLYSEEHRQSEFARHLSIVYNLSCVDCLSNEITAIPAPYVPDEIFWNEDPDYLSPLVYIQRYVQEWMSHLVDCFLIHGSLADRKYARGWSDVDTFVVVSSSTMKDADLLLELRFRCRELWRFITQIAPLQHHGMIVLPDVALLDYPSWYLPPEALIGSLDLIGNSKDVILHRRPIDSGCIISNLSSRERLALEAKETGLFKHHPKNGKFLEIHFNDMHDNMYQLHYLLSSVMTMPSMVLSGMRAAVHKRESFDKARDLFTSYAWGLVERASRIRSEWSEREYPGYAGNAIPSWVCEILGEDYFDRYITLLHEAIDVVKGHCNIDL